MMHHHWGKTKRDERLEQPIAATAKHNRSAGKAPLRGEGGSVLHASLPSTRLGKAVVRRKRAAGNDGYLVPDCL